MSVGKYSPTISASYAMDQKWWTRNGGGYGNGKFPDKDCDNDGYDSYGYSGDDGCGPDRAGNTEDEYLSGGEWQGDEYCYPLYEDTSREWSGKLLGDLNDYLSIDKIVSQNGLNQRSFDLYREFILKVSTKMILGGMFGNRVFIHKDEIPELIERYKARVPAKMQ